MNNLTKLKYSNKGSVGVARSEYRKQPKGNSTEWNCVSSALLNSGTNYKNTMPKKITLNENLLK